MLTGRPEGGNSVGKYACLRIGIRCPPKTPLLWPKRSWKRGCVEVFPSGEFYKRHPQMFWKERSNRLQLRRVESDLRTCLTPVPAAV